MIIPKQELNELLDGMEKKLLPAIESTIRKVKVRGSVLLANGDTEYKTPGGLMLPVNPNSKYLIHKKVNIQVNHKRRMKAIIEAAQTDDEMHTNLAAYQVKHGNPIFLNKQNKN